jgi:hypothetical protein
MGLAPRGRRTRARGHDVVAMDLPTDDESAGLSEYADTVVDAIGDRTDLVVVAHSFGAFTAALVCSHVPVDLLVLVAGMVPLPGERPADWWVNTGHEQARPRPAARESRTALRRAVDDPPTRPARCPGRGRQKVGTTCEPRSPRRASDGARRPASPSSSGRSWSCWPSGGSLPETEPVHRPTETTGRAHTRVSLRAANAVRAPTRKTTITEHEAEHVERANATGLTPMVFIHSLWLLPRSWDRWATVFEEAGYTALTLGGRTIPTPSTRRGRTLRSSPTRQSSRLPTTSRR